MIENLFIKLCLLIQLHNNACNSVLLASYTDSNVKKEFDSSNEFSEHYLRSHIDEINKPLLYSGVALGAGYDSYRKREVVFSMDLKPFFDSISVDLKPEEQSYSFGWVFKF